MARLKHRGDILVFSLLATAEMCAGQAQVPSVWSWRLCCLWANRGGTRLSAEVEKSRANGSDFSGILSSSRTQSFLCLGTTGLCPILSLKQTLYVLSSSQRQADMLTPSRRSSCKALTSKAHLSHPPAHVLPRSASCDYCRGWRDK